MQELRERLAWRKSRKKRQEERREKEAMAARAATMDDEERISDSGGSSAEPSDSEELGAPKSPLENPEDSADNKPNEVANNAYTCRSWWMPG